MSESNEFSEIVRIVDEVPPPVDITAKEIMNWSAIAKMAVEATPSWVEVPNVHRAHAQQISSKTKTAFKRYPGEWEAKTRKRDSDDPKKATLYVRYLPI